MLRPVAEKREHTPYQQKVIRQYYRNQGAIREQALASLVSDLWLAETPKKREALWKRAEALLEGLGVPKSEIVAVVTTRNVTALAEIANRAFASDPKSDRRRDAADDRPRG